MRDYGLDGGDSSVSTPDLQKNVSAAATSSSITSKDSYSITIENLPVKLTGKYNFVFQYYYQNPDKTQSTPILGPTSATYSIPVTIEDLSTAPTNVVATGGFYSYQLKWDTPTFISYGDTIVYESNSNSFNSSSKVVYVGTANQCTILTSDKISKYVYVVHRDMFLDANKKGTVVGPITIQDPVTVDVNPPENTFTVGTTTVQDDPDGLFTFNKKILFTWTENADSTTYGYQIRFRRLGTTDYTYMTAPGKSTTSTYLYGLKAGQTYQIDITTYDQFGNINTANWRSYPNIVISGSTSLQADVAITAGDMKLGYGIGGENANKGLYLGPENYWYVVGNTTASSAARLSIGGTSDKMVWNGTSLSITGDLTARAGTFSGNILMSTSNASIYNGTINAAGNLTGNGFALNSTGLKVANGSNSVTLDATSGQITANAGTIGGWTLGDSLLSKNNARLSSTGYIELGGADTDNIVRLDAGDTTYRMWIGRNSSATAPFKVTKEGKLYASGVEISGNITASQGSVGGWTISPSTLTSESNKITLNSSGSISLTGGSLAGLPAGNLTLSSGSIINSSTLFVTANDLVYDSYYAPTGYSYPEWVQGTNASPKYYYQGDRCTYSLNVYVCVLAHTSTLSVPNIPTTGKSSSSSVGSFYWAKEANSYFYVDNTANVHIGERGTFFADGSTGRNSLSFRINTFDRGDGYYGRGYILSSLDASEFKMSGINDPGVGYRTVVAGLFGQLMTGRKFYYGSAGTSSAINAEIVSGSSLGDVYFSTG